MKNKDKTFTDKIVGWLYLLSMGLTLIFMLFFCSLFFYYDKSEIKFYFWGFLALTVCFGITTCYFGKRAFKQDNKEFWFVNVIFLVPIFMTLFFGEIWARFKLPPWPAVSLHGVDSSIGKTEWGRIQSLYPDAVGNNSWGQRDKERTIDPLPGKMRLSFVGDSFLEESSFIPVSMIVESELKDSFEIINLGVSGSNPLDYYARVKNIALTIGSQHVFVFFFMGNDIFPYKRSILSIIKSGILSPPPRDSLLGKLVPGFNYYLTRKSNTLLNFWIDNKLHYTEQNHLFNFKRLGIERFPDALLAFCKNENNCLQKIKKKDLSNFYEHLTNPDLGLFRTYAFEEAVCGFCDSNASMVGALDAHQIEMLTETIKVLMLTKKICEEKGVDFTVVIIPQGFEVDDRLWEQWRVLNDFRITLHHIVLQAELLRKALYVNDINYIDLYPIFEHKRGTYLNFDGHWSEYGNKLAANALTEYIKKRYPNK